MTKLQTEYDRLRQLEADALHNVEELRERERRADAIALAARNALRAVRSEAWARRIHLQTTPLSNRKAGRLLRLPISTDLEPAPAIVECPHCGDETPSGPTCYECSGVLQLDEDLGAA